MKLTAIDGTGFEAHHTSRYFVRRRAKGRQAKQSMTYRRFPKVGLVCDCPSHLILAAVPGRGPSPDHPHLVEVMLAATTRRRIDTLLADAGYDGEWVHEFLRNELHIKSIIPPTIGRPTTKLPSGTYRRMMRTYFERPPERRCYGQRWQVETVMSMIKRRLGETLSARSYRRQSRALLLKVITHNVLILLLKEVFYRAFLPPFLPPFLPAKTFTAVVYRPITRSCRSGQAQRGVKRASRIQKNEPSSIETIIWKVPKTS